jgi:hypothetical protein
MSYYKTCYEIKLRKGRIDHARGEAGLEPLYSPHEKEYPGEKPPKARKIRKGRP